MYRIQLVLVGFLACCLCMPAHAQNAPLTHQDRTDVIDGLIDLLETHYVIPAMADQLRDMLRANVERGAYDAITSGDAFAQAVTADLQALSGDLHIRLRHGEPEDSGGTRRVVRRRSGGGEGDAWKRPS